MWVKPLRPMQGVYGRVRARVPVDLPDDIANQMIQKEIAVPCMSPKEAKKAMKEVARKAAEGPTKKPLTGGQDGTETTSLLSRADQAPEKKTSTKSKDDAE